MTVQIRLSEGQDSGVYYISTGRTDAMWTIRHKWEERSRDGSFMIPRDYLVLVLAADPEKAKAKARAWSQEHNISVQGIERIGSPLRKITRGAGGVFPSGKYTGLTAAEVDETDHQYLVWAASKGVFRSAVTLWRDIQALTADDMQAVAQKEASERARAEELWEKLNELGAGFDPEQGYADGTNNYAGRLAFDLYSALQSRSRGFEALASKVEEYIARETQARTEEYIGTVGEQHEFTGEVQSVSRPIVTQFGDMYITTIHTPEGIVVYKGGKPLGERGQTISFTATIKAHDLYRDVKQTVVARPKVHN